MKRVTRTVSRLLAVLFVLGACSAAQAAYPDKPIELYVGNSAGGGSDIFARTIAKVVNDNKLSPQPIVVINKPGGSSAIAYTYVARQKGNDYCIAVTNSSYYGVPLVGKSPVSPNKDFTYISLMCQDPLLVATYKDAPFKTIKELIDFATKDGGRIVAAGTSVMGEDTLGFHALRHATGIRTDFVPFNSSGEALTALLGKHVNLCFLQPAEADAQFAAGSIIPLACVGSSRLKEFPNVPTLKESGLDIELVMNRGVVGPLGMSAEAVTFLEGMLKKASETKDWQDYLAANGMLSRYLNAKEYTAESPKINEMYAKYADLAKK